MNAQQEVADWLAGREGLFSLFHVDVRSMRRINQVFGLARGDALLAAVEERLREWQDGQCQVFAPWGGEFVVICSADSPMMAVDRADALLDWLLAAPALREGLPAIFGALNRYAIGVVMVRPSDDVDASLRAAMASCAEAKSRGSNGIVFHAADQLRPSALEDDLQNLNLLQRCLREGQLEVHAQPIVRLQQEGFPIYKAEMLVRLDPRDSFGLAPGHLLDSARTMGVMPDVDCYIVRYTIEALRAHPRVVDGLASVALNLSAQTLMDGPCMHAIFEMVSKAGFPATKIAFEITETDALQHLEKTGASIEQLRRLGCRFVLDDFGVGYCSFGYLSRLPVDEVKIDGLFVREINARPENELIIRAIHSVASGTGKRTTAEFVESKESAERMRAIGIDYAQGWYFHPAMSLKALESLL